MEEFSGIHLINYWANFLQIWYAGSCKYVEGTKYVYSIEIGPMVRDTRGWKRQLAVPVNNTLVHHMAFLAADTWPCVLMSHTVAN